MALLNPSSRAGLSVQQRELLRLLLEPEGLAAAAPPTISRRPSAAPAALSFAQERLWFLHQLDPASPAYNLSSAIRLEGELDPAVLRRAFSEVARRHESLRTVFALDESGSVQIVRPPSEVPLLRVDLSGLPPAGREREVRDLASREALRPFDLRQGPVLRVTLLRLAGDAHVALISLHHIVSDAWSNGILVRELGELYTAFSSGLPSPLPELPLQYADFAAWQRDHLRGAALEAELSYWRRQLAAVPKLELPIDRPRPAVKSFRGGVRSFSIPQPVAAGIKALARSHQASPFMVALTGFSILLARHAAQEDVAVGTPVANRTRVETEAVIGFFINTLVLRTAVEAEPSFRDTLMRVRETTLEAYQHQEVPFEKLVEELRPERDLAHTPLFQVLFSLQNVPVPAAGVPGLRLHPLVVESRTAKFDLNLTLSDTSSSLEGVAEYDSDLFNATTVDRLLSHFSSLLATAVVRPDTGAGDLPLLAEAERQAVLAEWNDTAGEWGALAEAPLQELIEAQVRRSPEAVAAVFEGESLSYAELNRRANRLAYALRERGVGPEVRVGLLLERSLDLIVSVLAVLKAGGAYVPLDPDYPEARLAFMVEDSRVRVLLLQDRLAARLPALPPGVGCLDPGTADIAAGRRDEDPVSGVGPDNLAYVIYTSGSTGWPKGCMNSHRGIVNRLLWMRQWCALGPGDTVLQKTPFSFDVSVWELFLPLLAGSRLVLARPGGHQDSAYLRALIAEQGVTVLHFVPSMLQVFLGEEGLESLADLRLVVCSGEALPPAVVSRSFSRLRAELHNLYGPTEAAVDVTARRCRPEDGLGVVPIGRPITNLGIHLLDGALAPVPAGVPGELYIAGVGVGRGYLNRPDLTAASFVPDPLGETPGARMYRTGDLARRLPEGEVEFLGRLDHQVKVRGFRIELGELERVLAEHPRVCEAVVVSRGDGDLDRRLVAYLVPADAEAPSVSDLRAFLEERLPPYMVPAAFVFLAAMPLSPNGKVDRRALPAPDSARPDLSETYVAPRTETEEILAAIWSRVLGIDRVGVDDNFFALGGDSILSVRVLGLAQERGLRFDLRRMFRHQTIAGLAASLGSSPSDAETRARVAPFGLVAAEDLPRLPADLDDAYPMTRLQLGMLYHMELQPEHPLFHNVNSWTLRTPLDLAALQRSVADVVSRHPILRTSFHATGFSEPLQLVHRDAVLPITVEDLSHLSAAEQRAALQRYFDAQESERFDLSRPPLVRFRIHRLDGETFQFTLTENHAVADGWSLHATLNEIFERYLSRLRGEEPPAVAPLRTSLRDYVSLEREALASGEARLFWTRQIDGCSPLEIGSEPATEGPGTRRIQRVDTDVPAEVLEGLRRLARTAAVPLKSALLAVHLKALELLTGQDDVLTGMVTNGRPEEADGDQIRGLFLNVVPLRIQLGEESWRDLARRAFDAEREILPYRRFPMAEIQRTFGRQRLFQVEFNFIHFHVVENLLQVGGLEVLGSSGRTEQTDMVLATTFGLMPVTGALYFNVRYDAFRFDRGQARAIADRYAALLAAAAGEPTASHRAFPRLSRAERQQVLADWNDTAADRSGEAPLHELFSRQAFRQPAATALLAADRPWSFGEIESLSDRLARFLRRRGIAPGDRAGLLLERSPAALIAMLGVLKAGAAFVVLDPGFPASRLASLLTGAEVDAVLTTQALLGALPAHGAEVVLLDRDRPQIEAEAEGSPGGAVDLASPAYIAFTSGSTGRPKGVPARHSAVANYLAYLGETYRLDEGDTVLQMAALTFDASVRDLFGPLVHGSRVVLPGPAEARDPAALLALIARHRVTAILSVVPTFLREILEAAGRQGLRIEGVRLILVSGEPLFDADCKRAREVFGPGVLLVNQYGPTECTLTSTFHRWDAGAGGPGMLPAGRPIRNVRTYVLAPDLDPLPPGQPGEIHIGGAGVSSGFVGLPRETAERFLPDPFSPLPGARLYRTGDRGRFLPDGTLEFLGRLDRQVKLHGVRVEPVEIEAALRRHPNVQSAVVALRQREKGGTALAAYLVPREAPAPSVGELRRFLGAELPETLIPSLWVELRELPRLPNGKIDHRALPDPEHGRPFQESGYVAARTETEENLARLWAELLGRERVGVEDDFFELGGDSLIATRLILRLREAFRIDLPLRALFDHPTVAGLALVVGERSAGPREAAAPAEIERLAIPEDLSVLSDADVDALLTQLMTDGTADDE